MLGIWTNINVDKDRFSPTSRTIAPLRLIRTDIDEPSTTVFASYTQEAIELNVAYAQVCTNSKGHASSFNVNFIRLIAARSKVTSQRLPTPIHLCQDIPRSLTGCTDRAAPRSDIIGMMCAADMSLSHLVLLSTSSAKPRNDLVYKKPRPRRPFSLHSISRSSMHFGFEKTIHDAELQWTQGQQESQ